MTENIEPREEEPRVSYHFLGSRMERIVFLVLLTLISAGPIIFGKSIPSHADWHIHIEHAYNFKTCFFQGQWLPRWIEAHVNGYGLPIYNFYAPFVYYLFVLLELIFRNPILAIKWTFVIPMILCTVFGYLYLRRHGSPLAATVAMIFVIFSPAIHIFIYNTNWPNSTLAIAFLFLTLYGIDCFDKSKNYDLKFILITSTGYALMALTHLATAFVFTLLAVPYFLLSLYIYRTKRFVKNFFLSLGLGAVLSGFYLFPACLEKKFVHTDEVLTKGPLWDYSKNFLYTFLDRHRDDGYAWAIFDHRYYEVSNALFGLAVLACLIILVLNMDKVKSCFQEPFRIKIAITMFIISFLMMTPVSMFIWLVIKPMQTIQFPWRFTAFVLPYGALIMVYAFDLVRAYCNTPLQKEKTYLTGYKFLFYSLAFVACLLFYVDFINMYRWKWVPEQSLMKAAINVLWANEEYRPNITGNPNWKEIDFKKDFSPVVSSTNPDADITLVRWFSHERIFQIFSPEEHQVRLRILNFPGWTAYIDGRQTDITMDPRIGSIFFQVPGGKHEIKVSFELTPIRKISLQASFIAFIIYLFLLSKLFPKKKVRVAVEEKKPDAIDEVKKEVTVN